MFNLENLDNQNLNIENFFIFHNCATEIINWTFIYIGGQVRIKSLKEL